MSTINNQVIVPDVYSALVREKITGKCKVAQFLVNLGELHGKVGETLTMPKWGYIGDAKGKTLVVNKTVINYAKTVIKFHNTFLLGHPTALSCNDEHTLNTFNDIYKLGQYATVDYEIIDRVNKFGDAYEAIYVDNGTIKSKVLDNACSYPVYDDMGEYIAFIEHWTDAYTAISFWNVYYPSDVEVIYNVAMPVASTEMIANLKALQEMGAISKETIMEKTEYVSDVEVEKKRLSGENVSQNVSQKVDNPSGEVGNE